ncbi:UDP-glucose dehydrogenase family protein [Williamsia muralis]|uniref:UDP-glucose dehydrogenase family protein n=1 Tax=Williamsia marianensis TaxID=85044 RepID=UPI000DE6E6A4|nr:UDP-glucose/GDP-mannose dehydrogenase family protein [Williamsia marianensis]PVY26698.1 UDPglucose 6-dehydrogenase [Williamsia marianensis]
MRISVLGTGYLGATHAACMAELGHDVIGVDVDTAKIALLQAGELPFYEPGLREVLRRNIGSGRLRFTASIQEAAEFANIHFLAVGTPQKRGEYAADISYVEAVVDELATLVKDPSIIFGKSTVPVGTAHGLRERISRAGAKIQIAWNPEFLREGHAVQDTIRPDRIVLGFDDQADGNVVAIAREIYAKTLAEGTPLILTDLATAELVKVSANAFLATKISFINAISEVCDAADADVTQLADAIGIDERIGRRFLNAGIGFGGGCLPKDIRAFMARSGELGADQVLTLLREVDNINMRGRTRTVELARVACGGSLLGARIAVLGASFKPNSDDVRDSPALNVAGQMQLHGAAVVVYDPRAMKNSAKLFPTLTYAESLEKACEGSDVIMVLTEWQEFQDMDPRPLNDLVRHRVIVDGRNCLQPEQWKSAGWKYYGIGRR